MKMYIDECTRLRHMLEDSMRNNGGANGDVNMANIEEQF
jgi:hypothetical protein